MNAPLSSIEGSIDIVLRRDTDGRCVPSITSSRPFNLPRAFVGLPADEVVKRVGLLFSLCGQAQKAACLGALEAALGMTVCGDVLQQRLQAVRAEALRETALRDQPILSPSLKSFIQRAQALVANAAPVFTLGAAPLADNQVGSLDELRQEAGAFTAVPARLPDGHGIARLTGANIGDADLLPTDDHDSGLANLPTINGEPHWTCGPTAFIGNRLYIHHKHGPGWGIATVATARGLLTHAARVEDGLVTAYRITAPTEWNFHPDGLVTQLLRGLAIWSDWIAEAQKIVDVIDPCVRATIQIEETAHA